MIPEQPMSQPKKITILGAGLSSLSTAFHLTNTPNWKENYEITIYQMGWRVGGKCASGMNQDANHRIEEHGIHIFGNFYNNVFHMLSQCYLELEFEKDEPVKTMDQAFLPSNFALQLENHDGKVKPWPTWLPENDEKPWEGDSFVPTLADFINEVVQIVYFLFTGKEFPSQIEDGLEKAEGLLETILQKIPFLNVSGKSNTLERMAKALVKLTTKIENSNEPKKFLGILSYLDTIQKTILHFFESTLDNNDYFRRLFIQLDYYATLIRGLINDDVFTKGLNVLDDVDYRDWFRKHGMSEITLNSPLPQVPVNICFQYPDGNSNNPPSMSTSGYLYFIIRQIIAKGAPLYRFNGGTGEIVIAPVYRALLKRGVKFELFHKVKNLSLSSDKKSVQKVEMEIQATPKNGTYQPMIKVKNRYGWPSFPDYSQLKEGEELKKLDINLESYWSGWNGVGSKSLEAGKDYDILVLGISIGAIPIIAKELLDASPKWVKMVENVKSIQTSAFQIWMNKDQKELGFTTKLTGDDFLLGASYNFPNVDFSNFADLIALETWPADNTPKSLFYFCGPMQESETPPDFSDTDYPKRQYDRVKWAAAQGLENFANILPKANPGPLNPSGLDFELLSQFDPKVPATGIQKMNQQYFRANIDPTERYVLSVPGSAKYRLKAWDSGFANLVLCGDWIDTSLNFGSAETSIISGMLASFAICKSPKLDQIIGYQFLQSP